MYKTVILLLVITAQLAYCQQVINPHFVLTGHITNADTLHNAILINTESGKQDTVGIHNGKFTFTGQVNYPCWTLIEADNVFGGSGIWLSNDTIQADFKVVKKENGQRFLQTERVAGTQDAIDYQNHLTSFYPLYLAKNYQRISDEIREYVSSHRDSYYCVHLISTYLNQLGASTAKELVGLLAPNMKDRQESLTLVGRIKTIEAATIGTKIVDFSLPDSTNTTQKLSSLIKPLTLIHFWASWCKPCREHSPELVELYKNADPQTVQLIGISLDENRKAWMMAAQKDKMTWVQLSDLQGFEGDVLKRFSLSGIPYVLLVDQNYMVLANTLDDARRIVNGK